MLTEKKQFRRKSWNSEIQIKTSHNHRQRREPRGAREGVEAGGGMRRSRKIADAEYEYALRLRSEAVELYHECLESGTETLEDMQVSYSKFAKLHAAVSAVQLANCILKSVRLRRAIAS
jgi:hypothetical protein